MVETVMNSREASTVRRKEMAAAFVAGATLQDIADQYGITRQRVQQLIKREGIHRESGGHFSSLWSRYGFASAKDFDDACRRYPDCVIKFRSQRQSARRRGIGFIFTLKSWLDVWGERWSDRGRGEGFVMCRYNDEGNYEVGNVYIATAGQNSSDYQHRRWHGKRVDKCDSGIAPLGKIANVEMQNSKSSS